MSVDTGWRKLFEAYKADGSVSYTVLGNQITFKARVIDDSGKVITETCLRCMVNLLFQTIPIAVDEIKAMHESIGQEHHN